MDKEIYEDLFKNVVINGHYPFEKLNEMKSYIKTLNIKIDDLEQQCKKQKEVIDKITNAIQGDIDGFITINEHGECNDILELLEIYLDILKEEKDE